MRKLLLSLASLLFVAGSVFAQGAGTLPSGGGGSSTGGLSNPGATLIPATGVKADAKFVRDATWTSTSTAVSCPNNDCNFTSADTGKACFGVDPVTQLATLPFGSFTFVSAQAGTCSVAATGSKTANGNFVWGTDDTAAWTAAEAVMYASVPPACMFGPNGQSITTTARFVDARTSPTWEQCFVSAGFTQFLPAGNAFNFATCNGATGACFWDSKESGIPQDNLTQYAKVSNFGVQGMQLDLCPAAANNKNIVTFQRVEGHDIWIWDWCRNSTNASLNGINWVSPNSLYNADVQAGNVGINATGAGGNAMDFIATSYVGTTNTCMVINSGAFVVSVGGFYLGAVTQCIKELSGGILTMYGDQLNGASGNQFMDLAGSFSLNNINLVATNNAGSALLTRATGIGTIKDSVISETGTSGIAINTQTVPGGTVVKMGINTITGTDQTLLANSGVVLSGGWGTTATVTNSSGTFQKFTFQANSSGTGQAANPTMTVTFPVPWPSTPTGFSCKQVGGTGALTVVSGESSATTTSVALIFNGTPAAASTYIFNCVGEI
jgi:hypothetical protein